LKKVKGIFEELMQINSQNKDTVFVEYSTLFTKWKKYSTEDKNKIFSKNSCHELHLFIFFKDRIYFEQVVKPYLASKMEKTFVDFYLLEMFEKVLPFATVDNI